MRIYCYGTKREPRVTEDDGKENHKKTDEEK